MEQGLFSIAGKPVCMNIAWGDSGTDPYCLSARSMIGATRRQACIDRRFGEPIKGVITY